MPADNPKQDPTVRASRQRHRLDSGDAFLPDPTEGGAEQYPESDAQGFAEEYVASATTGERVDMDAQDEVVEEEIGGPFVDLEEQAPNEPEPIEPSPRRVGNAAGRG
jgi:hypothetical protein